MADTTRPEARTRALAAANFGRLRTLSLKRITLSALDPNRAEIDRVVTQMLGLSANADTDAMLPRCDKIPLSSPSHSPQRGAPFISRILAWRTSATMSGWSLICSRG